MLKVEGLSIYYGNVQALRQVSLAVDTGEIVALLGPNGAGKSSLLRAIVGLESASEGRISWHDRRLDVLPAHRIAEAGVALVPEGRRIFSSMNVRDNLLLGGYGSYAGKIGALLGSVGPLLKRPPIQGRLQSVFRLFPRLEERLSQAAGSLSGGEQQMLAIGRALMAAPEMLLLDEPSVGLAPQLVQEIMHLLPRLRDEGLTILLVEQDIKAALSIADRGYVMETGNIVMEGSSDQLLDSPRVRRAYLGKV